MTYTISERVFSLLPHFQRGVVVANNVCNSELHHPELTALLAVEVQRIKESQGGQDEDDPRLEAWDSAYRAFGANPRRDTPSIRFLISQIRKGRPPRSISNLVDAFNIISIRHRIPCGGDDLSALDGGDILLDLATGNETFAPLFRPDEIEHPVVGEIVYITVPTRRTMCRRMNWRNGHFSRIRPETREVALNVDCLIPPITRSVLENATEELASLVHKFCGGNVSYYVLNTTVPSIMI